MTNTYSVIDDGIKLQLLINWEHAGFFKNFVDMNNIIPDGSSVTIYLKNY